MLGLQVGGHVPGQDAEHARLTLKLVGAESEDPQLRVATKIFEDFGGALALNKEFIRGWEPVSIVHYTRPGTCINRPLH